MSIKISELPAATAVGNNDVLPIVQSGTTKKAAASLIKTSISSTINSSSTNDTAAGSKAVYDYSAPISHSTSATTYGVGTASNYGHCKTINNLTTASYVAGEALSAYQGKVLNDAKEDVANKTNTIDENSTSTQYPNAEATYQAISTLEGNLSAEISNLQAENEALRNQIPTYTATGTSINVKDSSNLPIKDFAILGNASQNGTPTPDNPVPIQVVTGDNTIKVANQNLLNVNIEDRTSGGITFHVNNDTTFNISGTASTTYSNLTPTGNVDRLRPIIPLKNGHTYTLWISKAVTCQFRIRLYNANNENVATPSIAVGDNHITFTLTDDATTFYLYLNGMTAQTQYTFSNLGVMLYEGSYIASAYEPYIEQTQLISLGDIELAKIGTYKDKLFKAVSGNSIYDSLDSTTKASLTSGSWYKLGNIQKRTYNGTENWLQSTNFYIGKPSIEDDYRVVSNIPLSNYFTGYTNISSAADFPNNVDNVIALKSSVSSTTPRLYIRATQFETTDALKTWLSTHNTNVYYVLRDTAITYTEITDTTLIQQLENVLAMTTYKNETNAFSIVASGNEEGELQIEYYQDIATLINDLRTAILSL